MWLVLPFLLQTIEIGKFDLQIIFLIIPKVWEPIKMQTMKGMFDHIPDENLESAEDKLSCQCY